jgi:hypothetical protein
MVCALVTWLGQSGMFGGRLVVWNHECGERNCEDWECIQIIHRLELQGVVI